MKVRSDFVTNSSSSSFVIAYRNPANINDEIIKEYPVLKFYDRIIQAIINAEDHYDTDEAKVFETLSEYDSYFVDRYGWRGEKTVEDILKNHNDEYLVDSYNQIVNFFDNGYGVFEKEVGYSDDGLRDIILTLAEDNDDFIVIEKD